MAEKLVFRNRLGAEIVFKNTAPFILQKFKEKEAVNIYNSKGMKQDGATYIDNTLDERDISMQIAVCGNSNEELASFRKEFFEVFNPRLGEGSLIYQDNIKVRQISCIVSKLPYFEHISSKYETCLINLTANNPFWKDVVEYKEEIATWLGGFGFELEIPYDTGIEIGYRVPSLIVNVNNKGDVECGLRLEFRALATVENPSILNINTGEYIKLNKAMSVGEAMSIHTYFGSKRVESILDGIVCNAFNYLDFASTFLMLGIGDNFFRYNADSGLDNLEVFIYYTPQYLGV